MAYIVKFRVQGYRAISAPLELSGLGTYVALYGDNAVGKSSVLQALALFGRLCATHPAQLIGTGRPWPAEAFFERFGQDPFMFNTLSNGAVELGATTNVGDEVAFRIARSGDGVEVTFERVLVSGASLLITPHMKPPKPTIKTHNIASSDQADPETGFISTVFDRLFQALAPLSVAIGSSPSVPVADSIRAALFDALSSPITSLRTSVRFTLRRFGELFPALGEGELDVLKSANHEKDLGWITPTATHDLDHLGGGVQSVVATLASLLLARANVVCLEEPEAFVGSRALDKLAAIFRGAAQRKICEQVWIATHAVTLVGAEDPIVVLERTDGVVTARQGTAAQLGARFAQPAPDAPVDHLGRLGHDGSVRLPLALVKRAGLQTGDFVYFVDDPKGIRILTGEQLDAALPVLDEP